ncbi:Protein argonaute, partial [Tilletia horrida]
MSAQSQQQQQQQAARDAAAAKGVQEAAQLLKNVSIKSATSAASTLSDFAPKPDAGGKLGNAIMLRTNMFPVQFVGAGAPPAAAPLQARGGRGGGRGRGRKGGASGAPQRGGGGAAPTIYQYDVVVRGLTDVQEQGGGGGRSSRAVVPARLLFEIVDTALNTLGSLPGSGVTEQHRKAFAFDGRRIAYTTKRLPLD